MDADSLYARATEMYQAGNTAESLAAFEQARDAYLSAGNAEKAAVVANDLGVVLFKTGRRDQARQVFQDNVAAFERSGNLLGQAKALGNLAHLQNSDGDKDGAERNYQAAGDLFHQAGEKQFEYDTFRALSQMQLQRGRWAQALATFDRALVAKGGSGLLRTFLQIPLKLQGLR